MPLVIPEGFGAVSIAHTEIGSDIEAHVTFGVKFEGTVTGPGTAQTAVRAAWLARIAPLMDSDCSMVVTVRSGQEPDIEEVTGNSFPGTNPGSFVSPAVALLVRKLTGRAGRSHRGRFFVPWIIPENALTEGGVVQQSVVDSTSLAFANLRDDLAAAGAPMYLLHSDTTTETTRTTDSVTITTVEREAPAPTEILTLQVGNKARTQRRRQS